MNYGKRLKELRTSKGLKQIDVADILDISSSAVGAYERCERQPTFDLLKQFAKLYNCSIDYILCNSDEKLTVEAYSALDTLDLKEVLSNRSVTLDGVELSQIDKQRALDIAIVLLFDRIK